MKSQPKLKDTLEVFLEELDLLKNSVKDIREINPLLQSKIEELKQIRIVPETKNMVELQTSYLNELSDKTHKIDMVFSENLEKIKQQNAEQKKNNKQFHFYILIFFIITSSSLFFAVKAQLKQSELQSHIKEINGYNQAFENYIKESKQIEKYNKWLQNKNSN